MVRHPVFSMLKCVIALLVALVFVGLGGVTVSAAAHDCGCQSDNSGPGSTDSGSSGSGSSGSGSSGPDNSGPGNADADCPVDEPVDPGDGSDPGDSIDPGTAPSGSNGGGSSGGTSTVVLGAEAPTQGGAAVPTAIRAGLSGGEDPPSSLAVLAIVLGLTLTFAGLARRRTRI